jgi:hypothetical protein
MLELERLRLLAKLDWSTDDTVAATPPHTAVQHTYLQRMIDYAEQKIAMETDDEFVEEDVDSLQVTVLPVDSATSVQLEYGTSAHTFLQSYHQRAPSTHCTHGRTTSDVLSTCICMCTPEQLVKIPTYRWAACGSK